MAPKPSQDTLIHCEACGEDYSSTYRSCPFCGARNDPRRISGRSDPKSTSRYIPTPPPARERDRQDDRDPMDDTYVFDGQDAFEEDLEDEDYYTPRPKGGKRLAPKEGGFDLPPINWPRLITFLCSLVIIVAALIIVFTFIYPQLHSKDPKPDTSAGISAAPSIEPSLPIYTPEPSPDVTDPVEPSPDPVSPPPTASTPGTTTGTPATVVNASVGLRVRSGPGISFEVVDSLRNGDPINVIAPADNGWYNISYSGGTGIVKTGYIMGDYISTITGVTTTTPAPSTPAPSTPAPSTPAPSGGSPTVGRSGVIVNAEGGLRVRSGPGTSHSIVTSLFNGQSVTVVADAGSGWYQITFSGEGGVATPGYIMGQYISTN